MGTMTTTKCAKRVFSGERHDIGGHPCPRPAKPGDRDGLCAQHRAAAERAAAKPIHEGPNAIARVTRASTVVVDLKWPLGEGPRFRAKWRHRDAVWLWIQGRVRNGDLTRVDLGGSGYVLKKDGTPGAVRENLNFTNVEDLPKVVADQLLAELAKALP